jgi:ubiquinol-cytochrome c reductase cytochrome c subunit
MDGPERVANQRAAWRTAADKIRGANFALDRAGRARLSAVRIVFVVAALVLMISPGRAQQPSEAAPSGNAQKGKTLFMSDGCYECHGRQGQGAAQTGAARIGPPMLSFEGFENYVRAPRNQMPPYTSKALPDQDLADIYAYLKSIPMPPKGKDIPLLNK